MPCGEFDIIARYFNRQAKPRKDIHLGIGDDCALLVMPPNQYLAISTDTLVSGTHFLPDIDPADLAYKSVAVNLSDLAAMGANPAWISLALTLPSVDEAWLQRFSDAFFQTLDYYGLRLIGGDTTKGPLSLTLTINGWVPMNKTLTRAGAKPGDWIYVTGQPGDSAAGLAILQNQLLVKDCATRDYLIARHLRPQPRVLIGQCIRTIATAAIDLSDGLISDLGHILEASGCGANVYLDRFVFSSALMQSCSKAQAQRWVLTGGEDYELCFTVPEDRRNELDAALSALETPYTCIGQITSNGGLQLFDGDEPVAFSQRGFDHFSG